MLTFSYTARNPKTGQKVKSTVRAENEQAAAKLIYKEGLVALDIKSSERGLNGILGKINRVKAKDRVLFSRQLATLINAGLPVVQSLRSVADQTQNRALKVVISELVTDVEAGMPLSQAMAKHPKVFNQVYISLIAAGETSGTLDTTLERLAMQQEKDADLMGKIRGAMAYPAIVVVVMVAVVGFMLVKVLPQVQVLYQGLPGAQLPIETRILLDLSHLLIKYWWVFILVVVASFVGIGRWVRYTEVGRSVMDKMKMRMWPIGPLFMKMYMARFARTASTLVSSGVPIIHVLEVTGTAVDNVHIEAAIKRAIEKIKGGKALSDTLRKEPVFLDLVPNMLHIGEQSGATEQMLSKAADYYEKEVDNEVKGISTIIEPVLMVVLGVVAFIIVAAVLLPIYSLAGQGLGSGNGGV